MTKGPLITRSELRKHKQKEHPSVPTKKEIHSSVQSTTKIESSKGSRSTENGKTRERSHTLNVAIGIVVVLLAVLFYIVFNW